MRGTESWEVRKMGRVEEKEGRMEGSEAGFTGFIGFAGLGSLNCDFCDLWDREWNSLLQKMVFLYFQKFCNFLRFVCKYYRDIQNY